MYRIELPKGIGTRTEGRALLFTNQAGDVVRRIDLGTGQARQDGTTVFIT